MRPITKIERTVVDEIKEAYDMSIFKESFGYGTIIGRYSISVWIENDYLNVVVLRLSDAKIYDRISDRIECLTNKIIEL